MLLERGDQRLDIVADDLVAQHQLAVVIAQHRAMAQPAGIVQMEEQRRAADERLVVAPKRCGSRRDSSGSSWPLPPAHLINGRTAAMSSIASEDCVMMPIGSSMEIP